MQCGVEWMKVKSVEERADSSYEWFGLALEINTTTLVKQ